VFLDSVSVAEAKTPESVIGLRHRRWNSLKIVRASEVFRPQWFLLPTTIQIESRSYLSRRVVFGRIRSAGGEAKYGERPFKVHQAARARSLGEWNENDRIW